MIGLEALSMQGLPVDELILTRETEDNLADLAGNAMSSTVVGAVMLASMVLSKKRLAKGPGLAVASVQDVTSSEDAMDLDDATRDAPSPDKSVDLAPDSKIIGDDQLQETPFDLTQFNHDVPLQDLLSRAQDSSRLCACEGRGAITTVLINRCQDCGHTSCIRCGGRPEHNYLPVDVVSHPRLSPLTFADEATHALPMCLQISGIDASLLDEIASAAPFRSKSLWEPYSKAVLSAIDEEFSFHSLKRQTVWVAIFDSPSARLEFLMDPKNPEWKLFAKAEPSEPANSPIRAMLDRAVARLKVVDHLLGGTWDLAIPASTIFDVHIKGVVDEEVEGHGLVPSWESRLGLEADKFKNKKVWAKLEISVPPACREWFDMDISGTYRWLPGCAAAGSSLHVREDKTSDLTPLYFFLDPTKYAKKDSDSFVFSTTYRRFDYGESRPLIANLTPKWRQSSDTGDDGVECHVDHRWVAVPAIILKVCYRVDVHYYQDYSRLCFRLLKHGKPSQLSPLRNSTSTSKMEFVRLPKPC